MSPNSDPDVLVDNHLSGHGCLVIGGTSKAGTTSVFDYLQMHPQIWPSRAKETRFFLDADYPLKSEKRYHADGSEAYPSFFDNRVPGAKWKLEATPDYLHSPGTAMAMREALSNVGFIFVLREPVSRLVSWFRFGQAMNEIPAGMTFDHYVQAQYKESAAGVVRVRHPAFRALHQGRYSSCLKPFVELFGLEHVQVLFYEDLNRDPLSFMISVCRKAGIDESYFQNFSFRVLNKSVQVRNPLLHVAYWQAKERLRGWATHVPRVRGWLRRARRKADDVYRRLNVVENGEVRMSATTERFLRDFYSDEAANLRELTGAQAPWPPTPSAASV